MNHLPVVTVATCTLTSYYNILIFDTVHGQGAFHGTRQLSLRRIQRFQNWKIGDQGRTSRNVIFSVKNYLTS